MYSQIPISRGENARKNVINIGIRRMGERKHEPSAGLILIASTYFVSSPSLRTCFSFQKATIQILALHKSVTGKINRPTYVSS